MQPNVNLQATLKSEDVQVKVLRILLLVLKYLPIDINIKKNKLEMVLNILVLASATNSSIHETCQGHKGTRTSVTVRNTLKLIFSDIQTVEKILNRLLKATIKRRLLRGSQTVITDLVEVEYYGLPDKCEDEIRKGQRKNGTNRFHAYATVYIYVKEQRYTLAITYVQAHETMCEVIKRLNRYLLGYAFKPSLWLLDRGYYCVEVIKWFRCYNKAFIMPIQLRGQQYKPAQPAVGRKPAKPAQQATGTYVYKTWTTSGWAQHTLENHKRTEQVTTDLAVVVTYPKGPGHYEAPEVFIYACLGVGDLKLRRISLLYKQRFAIETSYRQMREAKAKTASRHPGLRYAMVGISFVLRNVWISLHFNVLYEKRPGPGGRRICLPKLTFSRMLQWLKHVIESIFPLITEVHVQDSQRLLFLKI